MVLEEVQIMLKPKPKTLDGVAVYTLGKPSYGRILRIEDRQSLIEMDNRSRRWARNDALKPSGKGQWVYRPYTRYV